MPATTDLPRILVVTPRSPAGMGGVERHVRETTTRLRQAGVPARVVCAEPGARGVTDTEVDGVPVRSVPAYPARSDAMFAPAIGREIDAFGPDLLHVQSYHTLMAPTAMLHARTRGIPYVLTFHGGGSSAGWRNRIRGTQRRLQRSLYRDAARLIAIARFELETYRRELDLPREHFVLIPNGTDIASGAEVAALAAIPRNAPATVASIGRLEAYKGHHRAIAALAELRLLRPSAQLWIVGEGPYENELRAVAARCGVADHVHFTSVPSGDAMAMSELLDQVDLVLLLSEFETHPIVALEAAARRRRLVVADLGGLAELAALGYGTPVSLDLPDELIAAVVDRQLGVGGPTAAPSPFRWDDCTTALLDLYTEVTR